MIGVTSVIETKINPSRGGTVVWGNRFYGLEFGKKLRCLRWGGDFSSGLASVENKMGDLRWENPNQLLPQPTMVVAPNTGHQEELYDCEDPQANLQPFGSPNTTCGGPEDQHQQDGSSAGHEGEQS